MPGNLPWLDFPYPRVFFSRGRGSRPPPPFGSIFFPKERKNWTTGSKMRVPRIALSPNHSNLGNLSYLTKRKCWTTGLGLNFAKNLGNSWHFATFFCGPASIHPKMTLFAGWGDAHPARPWVPFPHGLRPPRGRSVVRYPPPPGPAG